MDMLGLQSDDGCHLCRLKCFRGFASLRILLLSGEDRENSGPEGMSTACTLMADVPGTVGKKRHPLIFSFLPISVCLSACQLARC